jgi:BirA family biotin operon repressor/biotin-[acetyl-CoA-carboxylase] ligase
VTGELPADIRDAFATFGARLGMFGRDVHWYSETASTNDVALALAERGAVEGAVVGADAQTAGRGRMGRVWSSPPVAGLYVSAILRPAVHALPLLTIAAGVAISEGIRAASGLRTTLKWPNDVYAGPRKLAGILAEAGTSGTGASHVVLGFGINLLPAAYPPDIAARATSIESELGRPVDRGLVLAACLAALSQRYGELTAGRVLPLVAAWRTGAEDMLHRRVECVGSDERVTGIAEDIDDTGALLVRTPASLVRIISGEVIWH